MICPRCKKGRRIDCSYVLAGAVHDDGYCSWCGRLWLLPIGEPGEPDPKILPFRPPEDDAEDSA